MLGKVPFRSELEDLFASDKSIVLKLLGGAFVGCFLSLQAVLKDRNAHATPLGTTVQAVVVIGGAIAGILVVLLLTLRDVVVRRVDAGQPVNHLLKSYFGRGNGCLMVFLWFCTVVVATIIATIATQRM